MVQGRARGVEQWLERMRRVSEVACSSIRNSEEWCSGGTEFDTRLIYSDKFFVLLQSFSSHVCSTLPNQATSPSKFLPTHSWSSSKSDSSLNNFAVTQCKNRSNHHEGWYINCGVRGFLQCQSSAGMPLSICVTTASFNELTNVCQSSAEFKPRTGKPFR